MPTVLVIDDDKNVRTAIQAVLRGHGYGVFLAEDGATGLNVFSAGRFDAVIVDIFMPELDGIATVRQMRAISPDIPLIIMSGHAVTHRTGGNPDFLAMAVKLGANCALQKPFSGRQLLDALKQQLRLSETIVPLIDMAETPSRSRRALARWTDRSWRPPARPTQEMLDPAKWRFVSVPGE